MGGIAVTDLIGILNLPDLASQDFWRFDRTGIVICNPVAAFGS
jgi:hypothetical protein